MRNHGFTLIELIVVISVIAVLAGIILPTMGAIIDDAKTARSVTETKHIATACLQYDKEVGYLPYAGLGGNNIAYSYCSTLAHMNTLNTLCVKYFSRRILNDPFGTPYRYWQGTSAYSGSNNFRAVACAGGKNKDFGGAWSTGVWANRTEPTATQLGYYMVFK